MTNINFEDVQGLVFSGYNGVMNYASYYLLTINTDETDKVRGWIRDLTQQQRITQGEHRGTKWCLNLAFSRAGLEKLGKDTSTFEQAFRDGMTSKERSTILGDQDKNAPQNWEWGKQDDQIDMLLMLFAKDKSIHEQQTAAEEGLFKQSGILIYKRLDAFREIDIEAFTKENFGFADGVSQPEVEGFPKVSKAKAEPGEQTPKPIPAGEFILGYPNGYDGKYTNIPGGQPSAESGQLSGAELFGFNGTYLVFRHLEQDVKGFWRFFENAARTEGQDAEKLAAKFVGRWKSGAAILPNAETDPGKASNDFDFRDDRVGSGCPLGSHVRRTNPRGQGLGDSVENSLKVANLHRLLRRGRSYGNFLENPLTDDDTGARGLYFICLNANIERQFEFVQHTWVNNIKFNGLYDEDDPLIGSYGGDQRGFTLQDDKLRQRVCGFSQFVTVRGGGYFFLPGIKALKMLG